jgi:hypothetical protein
MRRRAILALALTWGYYGLAILLALLLLGLILLQFASGH